MGLFSRIAGGLRAAAREFILDETWKGTNVGRLFLDWVTMGGLSADDEIRGNAKLLRTRARDLARNNPFVRKYLGLLTANVIGANGFLLSARTRDAATGKLNEALNDEHEDAWRRWAAGAVDTTGRLTLVDLEGLLIRTVARDGEAFVRMWRNFPGNDFGFALEVIDPDLVDDGFNRAPVDGLNEVSMGVELDEFGRPVAYHVKKRADSIGVPRQRMVVPAEDMIHLYLVERPGQNRGVSWLASVITDLKMLAGYFEAELVAARAASAKMGFWQRKDGATVDAPDGDFTLDANPGVIDFGPEGYEFAQWDPQHPTTAFPEFTGAILRSISAGLRVAYASLTGDLREANYGSQRGGLLEERDFYRETQGWFAAAFLRRVHPEWLEVAMLKKRVALPGLDPTPYLDVAWTGRGFDWIDPKNDAEARVLMINNGLASRTSTLRERGEDPDEIFEELAAERERAAELGVDLAPAAQPGAQAAAPAANAAAGGGGDGGGEPDEERAVGRLNGHAAPRRLLDRLLRRR